MKKAVAFNTFYQLVAKAGSMSVTVLVTLLVTRVYGTYGYGAFSIMQNLPALFYILADFGLNAVAVSKIISNPQQEKEVYGTVFRLRIFLSLLFIIALSGTTLFLPYDVGIKHGIFLSSFLVLTQALYATNNVIFQSRQRYDLSAVSSIAGTLVVLSTALVFSFFKFPVSLVSFTYVLGGVAVFGTGILLFRKLDFHFNLSWNKDTAKTLLLSSLPLGLMFVFSQINFKADSILLSVLKLPPIGLSSVETVGIYGLAYKIFEVFLVVPTFFMNSVYPVFVEKFKVGADEFYAIFNKSIKTLLGFGVVASVLGILTAPVFIKILGGNDFVLSINILRILMAQIFIFFLTQPLAYFLVVLGKQKILPFVYLVSSILNVTGNLLLIPVYGFYASSVLTGLCEGVILVLLTYFARKYWKEFLQTNPNA